LMKLSSRIAVFICVSWLLWWCIDFSFPGLASNGWFELLLIAPVIVFFQLLLGVILFNRKEREVMQLELRKKFYKHQAV